MGESNHVRVLFSQRTNRKIYELLSDKEGALNIFVAGTVNGCIDLQNANFMKYHDLVVRFEGKGKSPGGRAVIGITPFLTHIWKQLAKQSS